MFWVGEGFGIIVDTGFCGLGGGMGHRELPGGKLNLELLKTEGMVVEQMGVYSMVVLEFL